MKNLLSLLFAIAVPVAVLFVLEGVLAVTGVPKNVPFRYAHPPNFSEYRENIEFEYLFETNDQGLRDKDISRERTRDEYRILLIGDSFTEGYGVNAEETFANRVENYLAGRSERPVELINGGLSGAGPLQYWRVFSVMGPRYDVDALLICIYANDVSDMQESVTDLDLEPPADRRSSVQKTLSKLYPRTHTLIKRVKSRRAEAPSPNLISEVSGEARRVGISQDRIQAWVDSLPPNLVDASNNREFNGRILALGLLKPYWWTDCLDLDTPRAQNKLRAMTQVLDETVAAARLRDVEVACAYFPSALQHDRTHHKPDHPMIQTGMKVRGDWIDGTSVAQERIRAWAADRGIPFLDLTDTFRGAAEHGAILNYALDGHWTPLGHKVAASAISAWMDRGECFSLER